MNKSLKSRIDRKNLFDVPTYKKTIDLIKKVNDRPWVRPCLAVILATGARVGEIICLKRGKIEFIDYEDNIIENDKLVISNVSYVKFNLQTEKNRKTKFRTVPMIKNELFFDLISIIVEYCKFFKYDDTLLFPLTRGAVWHAVKRTLGRDAYIHWLRHVAVTNDIRGGVPPSVIQTKMGHTDLRAQSQYQHLNYLDLLKKQREAFGEVNKKEIEEVIDKNLEIRKNYNNERGFIPEPIKETKPAYAERLAHPEPDKPFTQEDIMIKKIGDSIQELSEFKDSQKEELVPITIPIDDPSYIPEPRKKYESKFEPGPQLPEPKPLPNFDKIIPAGIPLVESGMIIGDKVVIVNSNKAKLEEIKRHYSPNDIIPVHKPDPKYKAQMENLQKAREKKRITIKNVQDDLDFLVAVV